MVGGLPEAVRAELAARRREGATLKELAAWVADEPGVKEYLEREWGGRPIQAQNLSTWFKWSGRGAGGRQATGSVAAAPPPMARSDDGVIAAERSCWAVGVLLEEEIRRFREGGPYDAERFKQLYLLVQMAVSLRQAEVGGGWLAMRRTEQLAAEKLAREEAEKAAASQKRKQDQERFEREMDAKRVARGLMPLGEIEREMKQLTRRAMLLKATRTPDDRTRKRELAQIEKRLEFLGGEIDPPVNERGERVPALPRGIGGPKSAAAGETPAAIEDATEPGKVVAGDGQRAAPAGPQDAAGGHAA